LAFHFWTGVSRGTNVFDFSEVQLIDFFSSRVFITIVILAMIFIFGFVFICFVLGVLLLIHPQTLGHGPG